MKMKKAAASSNVDTSDLFLPTTATFISPKEFRPPLKAQPRKNVRKNRKRGRSLIATDTPVKN